MSASQPTLRFPFPILASEGAWYLAVAIIGNTDLTQSRPACELSLDEIFELTEPIPHEWVKEAIGRACQFSLTAFEGDCIEEPSFTLAILFSMIGARDDSKRIVAKVNISASSYLLELQQAIHQLQQRQKLTPRNLTKHMKKVAPRTEFNMKKNPRYKGDFATLYV